MRPRRGLEGIPGAPRTLLAVDGCSVVTATDSHAGSKGFMPVPFGPFFLGGWVENSRCRRVPFKTGVVVGWAVFVNP